MATWRQWGLQDAASPLIQQLTFFHDHTMLILTLILTAVTCAALSLFYNNFFCRTILDGQQVETVWTIIPAIILITLATPSIKLLYLLDESVNPLLTIKIVGHQWYWSYQYSDYINVEFDSYILPTPTLNDGQLRLLEVDHRIILPFNTEIRTLITSADVIHAWTIPALGVKVDAIPGRLNELTLYLDRPGVFYGQCSEICGANHRFIPIVLEVVSPNQFLRWIQTILLYL